LSPTELVVYQSQAGHYIITQVASRNNNIITLAEPLNESIAQGNHLWNFYRDDSHPNIKGFLGLADFALGKLDTRSMVNKSHAFIGDSWLDDGVFENRVKNKLNTSYTVNKAVGGYTSAETLNAFDNDFPAGSAVPDFFWIILGTNDYWQDVSPETYISNIQQLIAKINARGASAIVFDSSVGPIIYDDINNVRTSIRKDLSDAYANKLAELFNNNQGGGSSSGGSSSGGSSSGGSSSGGSSSGGSSSGASIVPTQGGGSFLFLELFFLAGLVARRQRRHID
jgi:uncharacterized membrane protein YgcG